MAAVYGRSIKAKKGLSGSTLKMIALFSMLVDHSTHIFLGRLLVENGIYSVSDFSVGYIRELIVTRGSVGFLYLAYLLLRGVVGRMAFPIFCFLLVEGFSHTHHKGKYAGRLLLFGLLSELPFDLLFYHKVWEPEGQNVFFTLFLSFLCMWGLEKVRLLWAESREHLSERPLRRFAKRDLTGRENNWVSALVNIGLAVAGCVAAELIHCDYGAKGVIAVLLLYLFRNRRSEQLIACGIGFFWEPGALLSLLPIGCYNGKKGSSLKYFFYVFYPAHMLALYGLYQLWLQ